MADSVGFQTVVAFGPGVTWGTPVACTQWVPARNFNDGNVQFREIEDNVLMGSGVNRTGNQGALDVVGITSECRLRLQLGNLILSNFFGDLTAGTYTFLDSITGKFVTMAVSRGGGSALTPYVREYDSLKMTQLVISSTPDDGSLLTFTADGRNYITNSATNTDTTLRNLIRTGHPNVMHDQWTVWIGDQADALASGDAVLPSEWTITLNRNQNVVIVGKYADEPIAGGFGEHELSLTIPNLASVQFDTWRTAHTPLQASFAASSGGRTLTFVIPNMIISNHTMNVDGPGRIPQVMTAMIRRGTGITTGTNISTSTTDDSFNSASSAFPLVFPGATIYTSGFTNAANNGKFTVVSGTTAKIIVTANLTTEAAGNTIELHHLNPAIYATET